VEIPLTGVLARMEARGVLVDVEHLATLGRSLEARMAQLEREVQELVGVEFNPNSPIQLRAVLYEKLGLKPRKRTKTGYSTDAASLEALRGSHPVVELLLEYRELSKLKSTYTDSLLSLVDPATGRIHTTYNQTSTATGRLSSDSPNLQNIPVRTELGREIRRAFLAPPGWVLVAADYSQIELRILAHLSADPGLTDAFLRGEDIHATTAARLFRCRPEEVTPEMRRVAKSINFGLAYGMNEYGLASRLGITPEQAREHMQAYFSHFPRVAGLMQELVREARKVGYSRTLLGRRRNLPELTHPNPRVRAMAERMALNAPIQGSAADLFKLAMVRVDGALRGRGLQARLVLTVHDELVVEAPEEEAEEVARVLKEEMEGVYPLRVPLVVEVSTGRNWAEAKP
jgi:DNA polymerase-1